MAKSSKKTKLMYEAQEESLQTYEVPVVLSPLLPEDVKTRVFPAIEEKVEQLGGEVELKEDWGKRHLAYEIKGNEEGYYIFLDLKMYPSKVEDFETSLRRMSGDVIRFLVIKEENL